MLWMRHPEPQLVGWFMEQPPAMQGDCSVCLTICQSNPSALYGAGRGDCILSPAPLHQGHVSDLLLTVKAPSITFVSFFRWTFRNVSINITDDILIAVFPLLLLVQHWA